MAVISFKGGTPIAPDAPSQDVIEVLETLLERAKAGRIRGIAYAYAETDNVGNGWAGAPGAYHPMSTAIFGLQTRWGLLTIEDEGNDT